MADFNIVEFIEKNPISKLSSTYNSKLITKIKQIFTNFEQQMFVCSFYCYLNYNKTTDFVVDLDNVWKWLEFSQKVRAKELLERHFILEQDYKIAFFQKKAILSEVNKKNGGQNIQKIYLTVQCFKSLCLKAQTKKASEIHEYYMKLEDVLQEVVEEESNELKLQLEEKDNAIVQIKKEKQLAVEKSIVSHFPVNTECIYFGTINNTNADKETLLKFGHSNDLATRVTNHRKIYDNFVLLAAFRVPNKVEIENLIKTHPKIKKQIRTIEVKDKNKTEIIAYNDTHFTIDKLTTYVKHIIHSKTYSIDNFNKLMQETDNLMQEKNEWLQEKAKLQQIVEQQNADLAKLRQENTELLQKQKVLQETNTIYHNELLEDNEVTQKFHTFIAEMCIVRSDVEETSANLEGQFRIWNRIKPQKELFHALKHYLDTRFKHTRLSKQDKQQLVYGYIGVKLKDITYVKKYINSNVDVDAETFLFQGCKFSPTGKILNSILLEEYKTWKTSVGKDVNTQEMKELKDYLAHCEYVLKATVWTEHGSNEGYYGLSLKNEKQGLKPGPIVATTTGKKVQKIETSTGNVLGSWLTIAKAAEYEGISAAKMSRSIKNKVQFADYFYRL